MLDITGQRITRLNKYDWTGHKEGFEGLKRPEKKREAIQASMSNKMIWRERNKG